MKWLDLAVPYDKLRRTSWPYGQYVLFQKGFPSNWYMGSYYFVGTEPFRMTEEELAADDWSVYLG